VFFDSIEENRDLIDKIISIYKGGLYSVSNETTRGGNSIFKGNRGFDGGYDVDNAYVEETATFEGVNGVRNAETDTDRKTDMAESGKNILYSRRNITSDDTTTEDGENVSQLFKNTLHKGHYEPEFTMEADARASDFTYDPIGNRETYEREQINAKNLVKIKIEALKSVNGRHQLTPVMKRTLLLRILYHKIM
jgi:hypothetical protein